MSNGAITWSPRLSQGKLLRLYQSDARGMTDPDLLSDVAITLYLRCKDIMAVYDAHYHNRIRCPGCYEKGDERYLALPPGLKSHEKDDYELQCPACGFAFTWQAFRKSHLRRQLNAGGAVSAFARFIKQYERRPDDTALMLAVDRLIHEFHYSLKAQPDLPTRIVGANLIDGKNTTDIMRFLDEMTYQTQSDERLRDSATKWRAELGRLKQLWGAEDAPHDEGDNPTLTDS